MVQVAILSSKEEKKKTLLEKAFMIERKRWLFTASLVAVYVIWMIVFSTQGFDFLEVIKPYLKAVIMTIITYFVFAVILSIVKFYREKKRSTT